MGLSNYSCPPRRCARLLLSSHPANGANVVRFGVCSYPAISACSARVFFSTPDLTAPRETGDPEKRLALLILPCEGVSAKHR